MMISTMYRNLLSSVEHWKLRRLLI